VQPSLRIVRVDVSGYRLLTSDFAGLDGLHRELQATIRRHLPGVTASVLALPVPSADGQTVDWYSDFSASPNTPEVPAATASRQRVIVLCPNGSRVRPGHRRDHRNEPLYGPSTCEKTILVLRWHQSSM